MSAILRRCCLPLLLIWLSACASVPQTPPAAAPWEARRQTLSQLQDWTLLGRIGVIDASEGWHGSMRWTQAGDHYSIDIYGPLGQGGISIRGDAQGVSLRTSDGQVVNAQDPEQLLAEASGLELPLNGMLYWVRGLPAPQAGSVLAGDAQGRLTRLEQDGWVINYSGYTEVGAIELPARITANRDDVQVKLVINSWKLAT